MSVFIFSAIGTTSACAENTLIMQSYSRKYWNYLRVRGEYMLDATEIVPLVELPPRARRILTS